MAIETVSKTNAAQTSSAALSKASSLTDAGDIQNRFIKLLVTQLQNQDPLSPMDNSQVTSQMAQLNTVTGIQNMNDTMKSMASSFNGAQTLQATSMLGRTVMFAGNNMGLANGKGDAAIDLQQAADSVKVDVKDSGGKVVNSFNLGNLPKGLNKISWDGLDAQGQKMPDGNYTFSVTATAAGQNAAFTALSMAQVLGVSQSADGIRLLTNTSGEQKLSDVQRIF